MAYVQVNDWGHMTHNICMCKIIPINAVKNYGRVAGYRAVRSTMSSYWLLRTIFTHVLLVMWHGHVALLTFS